MVTKGFDVEDQEHGEGTVVPWLALAADASTRARYRLKVCRRGPADCWYWVGSLARSGHAEIRAGSRTTGTSRVVAAHVLGWTIEHGAPPAGIVRHRCDEASCENPAHWVVGTRGDNIRDYYARRDHGPLTDTRGARGRAVAIREAIRAAGGSGAEPASAAVEAALAAALAAGAPPTVQVALF